MKSMIIKIIDKTMPDYNVEVQNAKDELIEAGFSDISQMEADFVGVDATRYHDTDKIYADAVVLIGKRYEIDNEAVTHPEN